MAVYAAYDEQQIQVQNSVYFARPLTTDEISKYSDSNNAVIVYPIFTQSAYHKGGFYQYYNKTCLTCSTTVLDHNINATYTEGIHSLSVLRQLHYPVITDVDVDKNPSILGKYSVIILLHNEYMTQNEFDVINHHGNTIHLFPNSMYALISVNYDKNTITLVKGHGYPDQSIGNGFGYPTSSKHEYDLNCKNYKWKSLPDGIQLMCYPEFLIQEDRALLETIRDYPKVIPPLTNETSHNIIDPSLLPNCDSWGYCTKQTPQKAST